MLKYKIYVFLFFFMFIIGLNAVIAKKNNKDLKGKIIYIDPGHGGYDGGAIYDNIKEKDICLVISKKIKNILLKRGATVYLSRNNDYDLSKPFASNHKKSDLNNRIENINGINPDLIISIHLNAEETGLYSKPQVFYNNLNKDNKIFAEIMQFELNENLNGKRKAKNDNKIYLLKHLDQTSILIELGFISNEIERNYLINNKYQNRISNIIVNTIVKYLKK